MREKAPDLVESQCDQQFRCRLWKAIAGHHSQIQIEIRRDPLSRILHAGIGHVTVNVPVLSYSSNFACRIEGVVLDASRRRLANIAGLDETRNHAWQPDPPVQVCHEQAMQNRTWVIVEDRGGNRLPVQYRSLLVAAPFDKVRSEALVRDDERRVEPVCLYQRTGLCLRGPSQLYPDVRDCAEFR